uniref:Polyprotein n=1 Tax=Tomato chlorosis virus TaxID=67754 RepID=A0A218MIX6_9CLOS|nr:polyprotein [Tomato chlorosis virus]
MASQQSLVSFQVDFNDKKIKEAFRIVKNFASRKYNKSFKRRLLLCNYSHVISTTKDAVSSNTDLSLKARVNTRMNVLRQLCGIPRCNFRMMPVRVYRKFGHDFSKINSAIDQYLESSVGSTRGQSFEEVERIDGYNNCGDGYRVKLYTDSNILDIFIKSNADVSTGHDLKIRLQRQVNRISGQVRTVVHAAKNGHGPDFSLWCDSFLLTDSKTSGQKMVMDVVTSVAMKIPDVLSGFDRLYPRVASKNFKQIRSAFIRECKKYMQTSISKAKILRNEEPTQKVKPTTYIKRGPEVVHKIGQDGSESFVVTYSDGKQRVIVNDDGAVRNLFNATLTNGKYFIHPRAMIPDKSFFSSKTTEYCWLDAFAVANKKIPDFVVPYPCLRMRVLYSCGLGGVVEKHCRFVRAGLYHFDPKYRASGKPLNVNGYVGSKVDTDIPSLGKNINVIFDDLIGHYVQGTNLRSDNLLSSNIVNRLSDRINTMFNKPKDLTIATSLSASEKRKVIDMFPELSLNFTDTSYSSHPIATAIRCCENFTMAKRCGNGDFIDAGGDVVHYMSESVKNVHVCTPIVDSKDAHRHISRSAMLDTMWGLKDKVSFCENRTEMCTVEKTNIVAVEVYDMSLKQMAQALLSHKAKRFDFSLIIPPEVCDPVCDVYLLNNSLHVTNNGDKIEYAYGDFGVSYFHDRENLRDILRTQMFVYNGVVFKKSLECSRDNLHFFSIVPCLGIKPGVYTLSTHYKKSESDKIEMTIPVREKLGQVVDRRTSVDRALTYSLIEYVMNTAARVDEKSSDYPVSQYRAKKSMTIKGNKVVPNDCDLPVELVPGYLAIILAEGLRLREKIQYFAKISYHRHYSPSIVKIFSLLIQEFVTFAKAKCYDGFVWVLRRCLSDKVLDKVIFGERRIHDCQFIMRFKQEVTVVGESGKHSILGDSIHAFTEASERAESGLTEFVDGRPDLFKPDDYEKLYDLVHSGGGNAGFFSKTANYYSPFPLYYSIYNFLSNFTSSASKVSLYTNFFISVIDWMRFHSISCYEYFKEIVKVIISAITGKLKSSMQSLWDKLKRCAKEIKGFINNDRSLLEKKLDSIFSVDDEIADALSSDIQSIVTEAALAEQLVTSGGGGVVSRPLICVQRMYDRSHKSLRWFCAWFLQQFRLFKRNLLYIPEFLKDSYDEIMEALKLKILSNDFLEMSIQGASFFVVNLATSVFFGKIGLGLSVASTVMYLAIKYTGLERRFLGTSFVNEQVSSAITTGGFSHPYLIPIRSLVMKSCQNWMKQKLLKYETVSPIVTDLIAKDVLSTSVYQHVTPYRVRMGLYLSAILALIKPTLAGVLLVCLLLIAEHAKFYRTVVVQANVHLSFASRLRRLNPTSKARAIKQLLVSKFDRKRFSDDAKEEKFCDTFEDFDCGPGEFGINSKDMVGAGEASTSDLPIIELDYSGKEIKGRAWGDISDDSSIESLPVDRPDGLVFSSLEITSQREKFLCDSSLPLSDALLQYPVVDVTTNVLTGDSVLDTFSEFFFLEKKKLHVELGKINKVVDYYKSSLSGKNAFYNKVWSLRNKFDDSSLYVSENAKVWYKLRQGEKGHVQLEGVCKYTLDNTLIPFTNFYDGFQVTSDELMGMFSNRRCLALQSITLQQSNFSLDFLLENVVFFNKPPGAGKTTTIVKNMLRDIKGNVRCLALTCTNAGKKEIIHKLRKEGVNNAFSLVMTYDSFLINGGKMETDMVYCDEIFMIHAGLWVAILSMLQFKKMECYGDKNQIPFINRVPNTLCQYSQKIFFLFKMIHDNVSYRCPPDVCYILSNLKDAAGNLLYPNGVKAMGPNCNLLRSMFVVPLRSAEEVPYSPDVKMIAFTKPEKDDIMRHSRTADGKTNSAQTVNEVQGGTFPKVELYRLRQYDNPIYNDVNQFVVSISRHTEVMKYRVLSTKMHDTVGQHISSLDKVADHIIRECAFKQQV